MVNMGGLMVNMGVQAILFIYIHYSIIHMEIICIIWLMMKSCCIVTDNAVIYFGQTLISTDDKRNHNIISMQTNHQYNPLYTHTKRYNHPN